MLLKWGGGVIIEVYEPLLPYNIIFDDYDDDDYDDDDYDDDDYDDEEEVEPVKFCDITIRLDPVSGGPRSTAYVTIETVYANYYAYWYDHDGNEEYYRNNPTYFVEVSGPGPADYDNITHHVIVYDSNNNIIGEESA